MPTFHENALEDQHIIISGGAGGIGVAVIKALTDHGAKVTINDILETDEAHQRFEIGVINTNHVAYLKGDMTNSADVDAFIAFAKDKFGPIHHTLCHAGMVLAKPLLEYEEETWDRLINLNVKSAFLLGRAAAKSMLADSVEGQLLFTTSWVAETPWPDIGPYNTSKAAMNQLMRSFARELAARKIRANAIAPGIVNAGMARKQWDTEPDYRARASKAIPLGYLQPLESVADAFVFACSDASKYMTGTVLLVDGGCSLYPMD